MKQIHILDGETYAKILYHIGNHHGLDLPNGGHLIISEKMSDSVRDSIEKNPNTIALPYLLDGSAIGAPASAALAHLGVLATDNTFQASVKIAKTHASFHPSRL